MIYVNGQGWLFESLGGDWYMAALDNYLGTPQWDVWQVYFEWWAHEDIGQEDA